MAFSARPAAGRFSAAAQCAAGHVRAPKAPPARSAAEYRPAR